MGRGNKICKGTSKAGRSRLLRLPLAASPEKEADRYDFALERTVKEILHSAAIGGRMHCHIQWSMELSGHLSSQWPVCFGRPCVNAFGLGQ